MTESAGTRLKRSAPAAGRQWVAAALGVWVAVLLVVDLRSSGPGARQAAAVALVGAVVAAAVLTVPWPAGRLLRWAAGKARRGPAEEADPFADEEDFFASVRRLMVLSVLSILVTLVTHTVVVMLALWAGVRLAGGVGLPVEVSGAGPVVVAGLVVGAVSSTAAGLLGAARRRTGRGAGAGRAAARVAARLGHVALGVAGLALAAALMDGVRLGGPGPVWRQALLLTAVVCVVQLAPRLSLSLPVPGVTSLFLVAVQALVLWAALQAAPYMEPRLYVDGFWPLVGTAALLWAVDGPARLAAARAEAAHRPPPAPVDPFPPDHMFPQGPYY
ncbi:phage holin family protein [Streptomyces sp. TRM64462]|uniref:phage holin family protein n=1 Tax=Streptomyces sp. TRM64462 TaxID=2741726 RepID=UPI0015862C92|nr:phage holin family protein [Streptomyces sp. TRM64462]